MFITSRNLNRTCHKMAHLDPQNANNLGGCRPQPQRKIQEIHFENAKFKAICKNLTYKSTHKNHFGLNVDVGVWSELLKSKTQCSNQYGS